MEKEYWAVIADREYIDAPYVFSSLEKAEKYAKNELHDFLQYGETKMTFDIFKMSYVETIKIEVSINKIVDEIQD